MLPIVVDAATHARLFEILADDPDAELTVDLAEQGVLLPDGSTLDFDIDPFAKRMILAGTDELGYLLSKDAELSAWEAAHPPRIDSLAGARLTEPRSGAPDARRQRQSTRRRNPMTAALVWADMHTLPRRLGSRPRALGLVLAVLSRRGARRLQLGRRAAGQPIAEPAAGQPRPERGSELARSASTCRRPATIRPWSTRAAGSSSRSRASSTSGRSPPRPCRPPRPDGA